VLKKVNLMESQPKYSRHYYTLYFKPCQTLRPLQK